MSDDTRRNTLINVAVFVLIGWTVLLLHISADTARRSYHDQQAGKAAMVAGIMSEFVIQTRLADVWDKDHQRTATTTWKVSYNHHDVLVRLADKILRSVEGDDSISWVVVLDEDGFVPWAWSRPQYGIRSNTFVGELPVHEFHTAKSALYHSSGKQWGNILLAYYPKQTETYAGLKSNAVSGILLCGIMAVGGRGIVTRFQSWQRRRRHVRNNHG